MVVLLSAYSNPSEPEHLRQLHANLQRRKGPSEWVWAVPDVKRQLTETAKQHIVQLYQSGMCTREIAEELSIGKSTVIRVLHQLKVEMRPRGRYW